MGLSDDPNDVTSYDAKVAWVTVGDAQPLQSRIEIQGYDSAWPSLYAREAERIQRILGNRVVRLEHAGSTSVPGLPAKPIIDMVLEVRDSSNEVAYAPDLEAAGYILRIHEPEWLEHRLFKGPDTNTTYMCFPRMHRERERMLGVPRLAAAQPSRPRPLRGREAGTGQTGLEVRATVYRRQDRGRQ